MDEISTVFTVAAIAAMPLTVYFYKTISWENGVQGAQTTNVE